MKIKLIKTCWDCEHRHYTGSYGSSQKYICQHCEVSKRNKVNAKYWYDYPILSSATLNAKLAIPDWCPLEDYKG